MGNSSNTSKNPNGNPKIVEITKEISRKLTEIKSVPPVKEKQDR